MSVPQRSGRSPSPSDRCRSSGDVPGRGSTGLRRLSSIHQRMAQSMAGGWSAGTAIAPARPAIGHSVGTMAGSNDRAIAHRSLPRPAQAALRPLDTRSRARSHRPSIRSSVFGLDSGAIPATLGFHTAKTDPAGLRARPGGSPPLAEPGISGYPNSRQAAAGNNVLE